MANGGIPRAPKHNNGLETFNSSMKQCQTEHQRQLLKQLLHTVLSIVRQRSCPRPEILPKGQSREPTYQHFTYASSPEESPKNLMEAL